jgi:hypothetical protein
LAELMKADKVYSSGGKVEEYGDMNEAMEAWRQENSWELYEN